jgi:regulator of protease activity HflC (stomatin/prohibitin superfamily)
MRQAAEPSQPARAAGRAAAGDPVRAAPRGYTGRLPGRISMIGSALAAVLLFAGVIILFKTVRMVPQGYEWTVERFGRYTQTLTPGLHFLVPIMYGVGRKVNMMEQVLEVPSQDVITKDNAVVKVDGIVFFQVLDAAKAAYEVATLEIAVLNLVMTNIRTAIGSMDLDESLSKRDEINTKVLMAVDQATHPWGIKVNRIELKDIAPPRDLVEAMARQMKAEREKRANILEAEGFRQAAILKAEGAKQSVILDAEGDRQAAFLAAEARERQAEAEAKATQMVSEAIAGGNVQAINYFVAQKYIEAFKALAEAPNQKFVMMPMESAGIIGSLGGIAELAKEAMDRQPGAKPPALPR